MDRVTMAIIAIILISLLQIWLSWRKSRIPGLILPVLHLILSFVPMCGMYLGLQGYPMVSIGDFLLYPLMFLVFNLPTIIHIIIFAAVRSEFPRAKKKQNP